ncbi:PhoU family transcriptional regulator [Sulfurospirillum sp. T05]|uniref:PhoU family transcriptional regulator n=1 Tax=Sulfurospirillum tamanense TaxID=2813362 RepID=A0ABS2WNQ5_9BACT|nr:PhoU domain-containing protein [Sulfurospirillum tamanensis]MBN2963182.1 PhoU family transcriptional regulator [Sulfurospirillum tamanensis]
MLPKHDQKLQEIRNLLTDLGQDLVTAAEKALHGLQTGDTSRFEAARLMLKNSGTKGNHIDNQIVTSLALFGAEATDLRELVAYLKATNEMVRISENIKAFSKRIHPLMENGACFPSCQEYGAHLCKSATVAITVAMKAFETNNKDEVEAIYRKVQVEESKTDDLYAILEKNILSELSKLNEFNTNHIQILSTMRKLERIADRAVNISKLLMFAKVGGELDVY